jgi:phosphoribosylamine--glycine ligase
VIIAQSKDEAEQAVGGLLSGALVGRRGTAFVIEEYLTVEEVSFISLCDGKNAVALLPTQDHKPSSMGIAGRTPAGWALTATAGSWTSP